MAAVSRCRPAVGIRLLRVGRPRTARRGLANRIPPRPVDRRSGGRLAHRPLRPPPRRRSAAARPFLLVASFVNPHDIVLFPTWVRRGPLKPSRVDPPPVPPHRPPTRICGPNPPRRSPSARPTTWLRPGSGHRADLSAQRAAVPRPLLPAARRGRHPHRPGAPRRDGRRFGERGAGPHRRPRRSARRARRAAPEVVQPLRRGHPGAVRDRPDRRARHRAAGREHTDLARRPGSDPARGRRRRRSALAATLRESFTEVHRCPAGI